MVGCQDMKSGEVYYCPDCGLELQVVQECDQSTAAQNCCQDAGQTTAVECKLSCCGQDLMKKA